MSSINVFGEIVRSQTSEYSEIVPIPIPEPNPVTNNRRTSRIFLTCIIIAVIIFTFNPGLRGHIWGGSSEGGDDREGRTRGSRVVSDPEASGGGRTNPPVPNYWTGYVTGTNVFLRQKINERKGPLLGINDQLRVYDTVSYNGEHWHRASHYGSKGWVHGYISTRYVDNKRVQLQTPPKQPPVSNNQRIQLSTSPKQPPASNNKRNANAWHAKGDNYWKQGKYQEAYEAFSKAYNLDPTRDRKNYMDNAHNNAKIQKEELAQKRAAQKYAEEAMRQEQQRAAAIAKAKRIEELRKNAEKMERERRNQEARKKIIGIGINAIMKEIRK